MPTKLRKYEIWLVDQQTTNPQQTIIEVTMALRPALSMEALSTGITYRASAFAISKLPRYGYE